MHSLRSRKGIEESKVRLSRPRVSRVHLDVAEPGAKHATRPVEEVHMTKSWYIHCTHPTEYNDTEQLVQEKNGNLQVWFTNCFGASHNEMVLSMVWCG